MMLEPAHCAGDAPRTAPEQGKSDGPRHFPVCPEGAPVDACRRAESAEWLRRRRLERQLHDGAGAPGLRARSADRPDPAPGAGVRGRSRRRRRCPAGRAARGAPGAARGGRQDLSAAVGPGRARARPPRGSRPGPPAGAGARRRRTVRPGRRGGRLLRGQRLPGRPGPGRARGRGDAPPRGRHAGAVRSSWSSWPKWMCGTPRPMLDQVWRLGGTIDRTRETGIGTITVRIPCE